jgi:hypothetical protein
LQVRDKKRERNLESLKETKKRIVVMRRRIASLEKECLELQQGFTEVQKEHEHLIQKFDDTTIKANQVSIDKAEILANKINALARAVDTDEEQLRRVLNVASLPPGEQESIVSKLRSILDQQNNNINQLYLKVAKANKDNMELFTKCQIQLHEYGHSEEEVSKILGVVSINDFMSDVKWRGNIE